LDNNLIKAENYQKADNMKSIQLEALGSAGIKSVFAVTLLVAVWMGSLGSSRAQGGSNPNSIVLVNSVTPSGFSSSPTIVCGGSTAVEVDITGDVGDDVVTILDNANYDTDLGNTSDDGDGHTVWDGPVALEAGVSMRWFLNLMNSNKLVGPINRRRVRDVEWGLRLGVSICTWYSFDPDTTLRHQREY
jgi:hypothetical protein